MYVKNVIVQLFTYFCHRNIYCQNASKWYFKTIWKCWGGWGFLWGEVFRYFKIPLLYAAEWIFCSSIYYSSNDLKNETVSCTERSLGELVTCHTDSRDKDDVSSVHRKKIFPFLPFSMYMHWPEKAAELSAALKSKICGHHWFCLVEDRCRV